MPWYQKFISNSEIRSGATTVRAAELVLSWEKRVSVSLTTGRLERTERWETLEENPQRLAREAGLGCTCAPACRFESRSRLKCKSKTDGEYVGRN